MTRPVADFVPAFHKTTRVQLRGYDLSVRSARPFMGQIHLVADNPYVTARAGLHKVSTATRKIVVLARVGERARGPVPMIDPDDHTQPPIGKIGVVASGVVVGIGPDCLGARRPDRARQRYMEDRFQAQTASSPRKKVVERLGNSIMPQDVGAGKECARGH